MLALNAAHEVETGPLDRAALEAGLARVFHAAVAESRSGFLLAYGPGARLASPNFRWFADRMNDFVYVDRVIVDAASRGRGVARALYKDVADAARRAGYRAVVAEVNIEPPNPGSLAFHDREGFATVGEAFLADRGKRVRYLRLDLG
ncbi:GNAT family N-acetyltransferase [Elioraea rosea]|uniref:GNAT family N-acetyltransferase n=1 Tax=Elioraea rosea TaxID=2492390 RepID=UPI00118237A2|nr:GNAT family N-acetyltransferase [Elioraea rosea]